MLHLLSEAGRSFLRAFIGALLIFIPGVLAAPDLNAMVGLATAAMIASVAAGLKAVQVFVPQLSFASVMDSQYYVLLDSFARAFLATFLVMVVDLLSQPNPDLQRSAIIGVLVAAVTAGVRALQGFLSQGERPAPQSGF